MCDTFVLHSYLLLFFFFLVLRQSVACALAGSLATAIQLQTSCNYFTKSTKRKKKRKIKFVINEYKKGKCGEKREAGRVYKHKRVCVFVWWEHNLLTNLLPFHNGNTFMIFFPFFYIFFYIFFPVFSLPHSAPEWLEAGVSVSVQIIQKKRRKFNGLTILLLFSFLLRSLPYTFSLHY